MTDLKRTRLYERHVKLGAQMVEFGGWEMPVQYPSCILKEHLATRCRAGLFDISHMGRFEVSGADAPAYLQHCLANNAAALEPGMSQYAFIADPQGGAVGDAYLYRFFDDRYLLVVNAANSAEDWKHLSRLTVDFTDVRLEDRTRDVAMLSLQGPQSKHMLGSIIGSSALPDPLRNCLSIAEYEHAELWVARTGYTGEPLCFELFLPAAKALSMWNALQDAGAQSVGLGVRVYHHDQPVGYVTSGTMVPRIQFEGRGLESALSDDSSRRAIGLALIDSHIPDGARVAVEVRGKQLAAGVMPNLLRSEAPPFARPITFDDYIRDASSDIDPAPDTAKASDWVRRAIENTIWRQQACINLIPSEQTASRVVRLLSIMDPAGRYAEHKPVKAFNEAEDLVTGSTHKTFFGTQRGIVALDLDPEDDLELWEAISRRAFPGSVSNHHPGTLLGLLVAAMEMNAFKDAYQEQVRQKVVDLRRDFLQMQYCFSEKDVDGLLEQLQALI